MSAIAAAPAAEAKAEAKPAMRILRVVAPTGTMYRLPKKIDVNTKTVGDLKVMIKKKLGLECEASETTIRVEKGGEIGYDAQWDSQVLSTVGIAKNGQKIFVEFPKNKVPDLPSWLGSDFLAPGQTPVGKDAVEGRSIIGIYFSRHSCGPCRSFTPVLRGAYQTMKDDGVDVEILFVSGDQTDSEFASYYAEMPWLAFPLGDPRCHVLSRKFQVTGVPTLVWITGDGTTISTDGRSMIASDPSGSSVVAAAEALS